MKLVNQFFRFLLGSVLFLVMTSCLLPLVSIAEEKRPNILWISLEDISPDLGCYGDEYAVTPNIDRFAKQGLLYTNAFSHSGVCAPTRSGIITGMYPTSIGTHHMRCQGVPPAEVKCFTEYLRAAGYYCSNDSKTDYQFASPVTAWDDSRRGAHWRGRPDKNQPFFSVINLTSCHESKIRQPEKQFQKVRQSLAPHERHDPDKAVVPPYIPNTPITRNDWSRLADIITYTDKIVGKILQDLEDDGLAENTVVFFWGDHGRGLPRGKRWIYDSGMQVPFVVRWPGHLKPDTTTDELVCFLDLAPTVLSLAGVDPPKYMQGQIILGQHKAADRDYVFAARDRMDETYDIIRAVRDKRFKYIRNYMPERTYAQNISYMDEMPTMKEMRRLHAAGKLKGPEKLFFRKTKPIEELYDITVDPHEINNLAADKEYQATLRKMRQVHQNWMKETGDLGLIPEPILDERARPGGVWSIAADPVVSFDGSRASIACSTPGASIAYQIGPRTKGKRQSWRLYSKPFTVQPGDAVRTKACRLGYKDSAVVRAKKK